MKVVDPNKLGAIALENTLGQQTGFFSDEPNLPITRIRKWLDGRQFGDTMMIGVLGCNMNCAHCYMPNAVLRASMKNSEFNRERWKLPARLRDSRVQSADDLFDYAEIYWSRNNLPRKIELTDGEPTLYRGGIRRLAELAKERDAIIAINTNGLLISQEISYLDVFSDVSDSLEWMVSFRGTNKEAYERFTITSGEHYMCAFDAYERLHQQGYDPHAYVTMDTLSDNPKDFQSSGNPVDVLVDFFSTFNSKDPFYQVTFDGITGGIFQNKFKDTHKKMIAQGYWFEENGTVKKPALEVRNAVRTYLKNEYDHSTNYCSH